MEKLIDALIANAAANVAVLALGLMVMILLYLLQQQRTDFKAALEKQAASAEKHAQALNALADLLNSVRFDLAFRGIRK